MDTISIPLLGSVVSSIEIGVEITELPSEINVRFDERGISAVMYDSLQRTRSHQASGTAGRYGINQQAEYRDDIDVQGTFGELALASFIRKPWRIIRDGILVDPLTGLKYADVGDMFEAKSVRRERNSTKRTSLLVHADDIPGRKISLAAIREDNTVSLLGWMEPTEAWRIGQHNPPYLREQSNVWAVPVASLRNMKELV